MAVRCHQIGGLPNGKLALPWAEGGERLFMGDESCTGRREEGSSSFLALLKCCLEASWILPSLQKEGHSPLWLHQLQGSIERVWSVCGQPAKCVAIQL